MNKPLSLRQGSSVRRIVGVSVFLFLLWLWPATLRSAQAKTIYVNGSVQGGNNGGSSWANAFTKLQDALANALAGDEIWVAKGVYYPDEAGVQDSNDRNATFSLKNGVALYGGFAGGETSQSTRKWETNVTVLSGDIDKNDANADNNNIAETWNDLAGNNAYHVVTGSGVDASALLEGFFITAGKADGDQLLLQDRGAGMFNDNSSPTLSNLDFSGNHALYAGGGMRNDNGSNPVLTAVDFSGNRANQNPGGGMDNFNSNPQLTNVRFFGNQAAGGGGMGNSSSSPKLTNVLFSGNRATQIGGGMLNENGSSPVLTNVTVAGNQATTGGGLRNTGASNPQLVNTIVWGNAANTGPQISNNNSTPVISYSLVEGLNPAGTGNLDGTNAANDPKFVALQAASNAPTTAGDYRLQDDSPAMDVGNNAANNIPDLDGNRRPQGGDIDLGAYETYFKCPAGGVLYVKQGGAGKKNGRDWANAFAALQNALDVPAPCEIWVAEGVYYPDEGLWEKNDDTSSSFWLRNGIALYGGFAGTESNRTERNPQTHVTVLSGDVKQDDKNNDGNFIAETWNDIAGDNAHPILRAQHGIDATAILDGFTITAGNSPGSGGGMFNLASSPLLRNLIFSGNLAARDGGGLYNSGSSKPTLESVTFRGNKAKSGGGMSNSGSPVLTNITFSGNQAQNGGGLLSSSGTFALTTVTFSGNQADASGGGLYIGSGSLTLTGGVFTNNRAKFSGGGLSSSDSTLQMFDTTLQSNQADSSGGGMDVDRSDVELTRVTLKENTAVVGGGLSAGLGSVRLTNVTIAGNRAAWGGGIDTPAFNNGGTIVFGKQTLINVVIIGNLADPSLSNSPLTGQGGGIFNQGEQTLINVTLAGNRAATGGAIYNENKLILKNTIVWGNDAPTDAQLANRNNGTATLSYSVLEGQNPAGAGNLDGANAANNPNFVAAQAPGNAPTSAGDYRRQPVSPATDVGNDAVNETTSDLAGQPRKQGTAIDLGAYENARVVVNPTGLGVGEPNGTATFRVTLTSAPTADVTSTLFGFPPDECSVPPSVQLTPANWQTGVEVTVSAVDDTVVDGPQPCTIETLNASSDDPAYKGASVADVAVTVGDDEKPGVVVNPTSFTLQEANEERPFVITLLAQPAAPVTIDLASNTPGACTVTPASVTLDANNWQTGATATVRAEEDEEATGPRLCTIKPSPTSSPNTPYHRLVVDDVTVTVIDNDVVGMTGNPAPVVVSEPNSAARFTLSLKIKPAADVIFTLSSSNPAACSVPADVTLTPATWQAGAEITVSAVDDRLETGDRACGVTARATSTDVNYEGQQANVPVTVLDDDRVQVVAEPAGLQVQEPNSTANFTVKLTKEPIAAVKVTLTSTAPDECSVTGEVTLDATNWQAGLPVTVSAADDALVDGPQPCLITSAATSTDLAYEGRLGNEVAVTVADNEQPNLTVSPDQLTISTANGSASFTVKLTIPPVNLVGLALSSDNPACTVPGNVTPTTNAWQTGEAIAVTAAAAGPQTCSIRLTTSSTTAGYDKLSGEVKVTIVDPNETLTVNKASNGSGAVTSSPAGIACGVTCSAAYARNTQVTLTATPEAGSTFGSWSGACAGSGACTVTLDRAQSVTAAFNKATPPPQTLTVSKAGSGSGGVKSNPAGVNCSATCAMSFAHNTPLTLSATPAAGSIFTGWSGACTGTGACQVTLDSAKNVVATFTLIPPTTQTLSVTKAGNGSGTVAGTPAGLDCGPTCKFVYDHNAVVTLTATPDNGSVFIGWSGAGCSGTGACQVTLDATKAVIANFNKADVTIQLLTVSKAGSGGGTVKSNPVGIDCGTACSFAFVQDAQVTLTATPATGSTFAGWSGACSGIGSCQVTLNSAKSVTATFNPVTPALQTLTVSKAGSGAGTVKSSPVGIDCGMACTFAFVQGTPVKLTATQDAGSTFAGWSGACTGTGDCQVTMDGAKTVTATFNTVTPTAEERKVYLPVVRR